MLATNSEDIFKKANGRSWFGMNRKKRDALTGRYLEDISEVGYKMRMNGFLAAIGREQLRYIDEILVKRREKAKIYDDELEEVKGVRLMKNEVDRKSAYFLYPIHVDKRQKFLQFMRKKGIELTVQSYRNDVFSVFGRKRKDLPNTDRMIKTLFVCDS